MKMASSNSLEKRKTSSPPEKAAFGVSDALQMNNTFKITGS